MRVIAGEKKGISLAAVPGRQTRPTTDRVKESMFNILSPYIHGGNVLDLFAGSGALGIETLSRGADQAIFIDNSYPAIQCIKKNLQAVALQRKAEVYKVDWKIALDKLEKRNIQFDYVFLDPPYSEFQQKLPNIISLLIDKNLLADQAIIMSEHDVKFDFPDFEDRSLSKHSYKYGNTGVTVFRMKGDK